MKLGAKRAELMQKFVHEVASEFFATNAPDQPNWTLNWCFSVFRTIWVHLGPFGHLRTRCKTGRTSAKVCATKSRRNFSQRTHRSIPVDPKLMFWCVLFYLGTLRTVLLHYETRCKTGRTSAKVRARSRVGIFRNECTRSTPLDPKLMFWCVLFYLGALRIVWSVSYTHLTLPTIA